jgi:hypothetical protein
MFTGGRVISAPPDSRPLVVSSINPPSVYADQMSRLRAFPCLPAEDPRRQVLLEALILAFLPVAKNLAGRHANGNTVSVGRCRRSGWSG